MTSAMLWGILKVIAGAAIFYILWVALFFYLIGESIGAAIGKAEGGKK